MTLAPADLAPRTWADRSGSTWIRLDVVGDASVVRVDGSLGVRALQPCRAALDAAVRCEPRQVVFDLARTYPPEPVTVTLLGAVRRYLRTRGVDLTLAAVPDGLQAALEHWHVIDLYDVRPSVAAALGRS